MVREKIRFQKAVGKIWSARMFLKMSSGNVLGAFFQFLPTGINDSGFGG